MGICNSCFGGFLLIIAFAMMAPTGNIYYGFCYPNGGCGLTVIVGLLFLLETRARYIND